MAEISVGYRREHIDKQASGIYNSLTTACFMGYGDQKILMIAIKYKLD